jgi:hypothetical protein
MVSAPDWQLLLRHAWINPATVVAGTTGRCADLASVRWIGLGPASHCGSGYDR